LKNRIEKYFNKKTPEKNKDPDQSFHPDYYGPSGMYNLALVLDKKITFIVNTKLTLFLSFLVDRLVNDHYKRDVTL